MGRLLAENKEERLAICRQCPFFVKDYKCSKCGCNMNLKTQFAMCRCPIDKWGPKQEIK